VLFGFVTAPPVPELPVVVPFIEDPVVVPLPADPPAVELPPAAPPEDPPLCASANVLESAKAVANAIVVSFIVVSLFSDGLDNRRKRSIVPKKPAFCAINDPWPVHISKRLRRPITVLLRSDADDPERKYYSASKTPPCASDPACRARLRNTNSPLRESDPFYAHVVVNSRTVNPCNDERCPCVDPITGPVFSQR